MKVVQVTPTTYPAISYGGGSLVTWELSRALSKNGIEVTLLSTDAYDDCRRLRTGESESEDISIIRLKNLSNRLAFRAKMFLPVSMGHEIETTLSKADLVHCHDFRTVLNLLACRTASRLSKPLIVQPHGVIKPEHGPRSMAKTLFDSVIGRRIIPQVDAWIALSKQEKENLVKFGAPVERVFMLKNGIDLQPFGNLREKRIARRTLGWSTDDQIVLYMGRIHRIKNIDLLIRSIRIIDENMESVKLHVVGPDDGDLSRLRKIVNDLGLQEIVTFDGTMMELDKMDCLSAADVFALPSSVEAFPISVLEACATGLPVVATRCCDLVERVHGRAGIVVDESPIALSDGIRLLLSEKELMKVYSVEARKFASEYSWENVVVDFIDFYRKILESGDGRT